MNPANTGSFGAATGGLSPELQEAMQRRAGNTVPTTAQVTNSAPTANPTTQIPSMQPQATSPQQTGSALPFDSTEAKIILQAMGGRLKAISKLAGA